MKFYTKARDQWMAHMIQPIQHEASLEDWRQHSYSMAFSCPPGPTDQNASTDGWVCDSKAAISNVSKITDKDRFVSKQPNHADYLGMIKETVATLPEPMDNIWVKGHQTRPKEGEIPTRQSDITHNNYVDHLATWYREQTRKPQSKECIDHVASSIISVSINKQRLVSNIEESIRSHMDGYQLRQYTQKKHKWHDKTWTSIDFEPFGSFYKRLPAHEQDAFTKFMFGHQNVGLKQSLQDGES
jgi:hypothetical protein